MKAKFINEKFADISDPIKDMGIGVFMPYEEYDTEVSDVLNNWIKKVKTTLRNKTITGKFLKATSFRLEYAEYHEETNVISLYVDNVTIEINKKPKIVITNEQSDHYKLIEKEKYKVTQ